MDQLIDAELMARPDDIAAVRELLRRIRLERDTLAAERDAAVLAACQVVMIADGYALMREREMIRHLTCSAQHRLVGLL